MKNLACLRGEVLGRAAERAGRVAVVDVLLAQPEVCNLDVTVVVEQEVLQLQMLFYFKFIKTKMPTQLSHL